MIDIYILNVIVSSLLNFVWGEKAGEAFASGCQSEGRQPTQLL
jgi:hypothetical protein